MKSLESFCEELKAARQIKVDERYYADTYLDNIYRGHMKEKFVGMFREGGGKELLSKNGKKEKAACIYSSSMLAYNFFSWIDKNHPLSYEGVKYDKVVFEEQFRVLKNRNNKANLDVVLVSEDNKKILLLESKFTEHLVAKDSVPAISDAYDLSDSYFEDCYGGDWVQVIKELRGMPKAKNKKAYYEGLKQVVCHLIGISSAILNPDAREWFNKNSWLYHMESIGLKGDEEYRFMSIVFHPNAEEEDKLSSEYEKLNEEFVCRLNFLPENLIIDNPIITYKQLWEQEMEASIQDKELKDFLNRYLGAHA